MSLGWIIASVGAAVVTLAVLAKTGLIDLIDVIGDVLSAVADAFLD